MSQRRVDWLLASVLGFGLVVSAGCRGGQHSEGMGPPATRVRFAEPKVQPITDYVYFTGRTEAVESVEVRARVTGYLEDISFKEGDEVTKGQQLYKIDPRPYQAVFDQADGQVKLAEARLKLAHADLARGKKTAETPGAISQQELDTYAAKVSESSASLTAQSANRESAELNLNFTQINSPIDGIISRTQITRGNLVTQDATLLTTIVSQDPIFAYFDVDERTMLNLQRMIREGQIESVRDDSEAKVELALANDGDHYPHEGTLDFVNNKVNPSTGTIQLRGRFANPKPERGRYRMLTPGLFVRVRLPVGKPHDAMLIPQAAIGTDQGQKFVFVVTGEGVIENRPIALGATLPGGQQVIEPIKLVRSKDGLRIAGEGESGEPSIVPTDKIVVGGLQRIRPGMRVDAQPVGAPGK